MIGTRIHVTGIVQGVGFRPFVYNRALENGLTGWVRNTSAGVDIEVNGSEESIDSFIQVLKSQAPPLSRIDSLEYSQIPSNHFDTFEIVQSETVMEAFQPISPDIGICPDCLRELFDPTDRRYRYPFTNCTNCGPRLTIIEDLPYDRPKTTMRDFQMCPECRAEYEDPTDRRFHAQPIACPECGPQVWLEFPRNVIKGKKQGLTRDKAIRSIQEFLLAGKVVAIKGLGGFHLACDATNPKAVAILRQRKLRVDKPFALMMADLQMVEENCTISSTDRELLMSRERPIVLLPRKASSQLAEVVAPWQTTLGVMLPYTPLHYLLFASPNGKEPPRNKQRLFYMPPLVMTSGNISEEPLAFNNDEAMERLSSLADAFLLHDRPIRTRCDDSVLRTFRGYTFPLRRSRGYAPFPVYLAGISPQVLAVGGELKNTFCVTRDRYAFLSHHIGDMENYETFLSFLDGISQYESLFRIKPQAIAHDLHPNYLSTRYATERCQRESIQAFGIQHHHAHIASCMAEHGIAEDQPVIGIAFDGTGYGEDGAIWGGEFLLATYKSFKRFGHLKYIPLPGGDTAIRKPARTALAYLTSSGLDWDGDLPPVSALCAEERSILRTQIRLGINTPLTSSIGRFFDAISALCGVRQEVNYEAQAAIEFENLCDTEEKGIYEFPIVSSPDGSGFEIDPAQLTSQVVTDLQNHVSVNKISSRVHNSLAQVVNDACLGIRKDIGINQVVLSGGVWQNHTLLNRTYELLDGNKFIVYIHRQVPTNDGGLSLGQAVVAIHRMKE